MEELVSIIMPSYNTGKYIKDAIYSVINQTYQNWELIIIDDCSSDDTIAIIKQISDSRIVLLQNKINSGAAVSRNYGLRESKGKWIAFLDSDDLWLEDKLQKQIRFMKENEISFSYTSYTEIDSNSNKTGVSVTGPKRITKTGFFNYCWPGCLTVMYDRDKVGLVQIYDIKKNNDYAMWLQISKKVNCYLLDEELAMYRRGRIGSVSTHSIMSMVSWHYKLFREAEGENIICSVINTVRNLFFGLIKKICYVRRRNRGR